MHNHLMQIKILAFNNNNNYSYNNNNNSHNCNSSSSNNCNNSNLLNKKFLNFQH